MENSDNYNIVVYLISSRFIYLPWVHLHAYIFSYTHICLHYAVNFPFKNKNDISPL